VSVWVAAVRPTAFAVREGVPATFSLKKKLAVLEPALMVTLEVAVAQPAAAAKEVVADVELSATEVAPPTFDGLPNESCDCTVRPVAEQLPAVTVTAAVRYTRRAGAAALMVSS